MFRLGWVEFCLVWFSLVGFHILWLVLVWFGLFSFCLDWLSTDWFGLGKFGVLIWLVFVCFGSC